MLYLPDELPYHFLRTHLPSDTTRPGEFSPSHGGVFSLREWQNTQPSVMVNKINHLITEWNRQQPNTWKYEAVAAPYPREARDPSGVRTPDGTIVVL